MGSKVRAICDCGVNKEILIGGGMSNYKYISYFPCLCENCNNVVEVNLLEKNLYCPDCNSDNVIPYDDNQLKGIEGDRVIISWNVQVALGRELKLTNGRYKCPKCKKTNLRFLGNFFNWD